MSFIIIVLNLFQSGKFSNICSKYESFQTSAEFLIVFRKHVYQQKAVACQRKSLR